MLRANSSGSRSSEAEVRFEPLGWQQTKRPPEGGLWAENFSEFERAEPKFLSDDVRRRRRRDERKRRVWKLHPDRKIFRRDSEPPKSEHVSTRFSHSSDLCPGDLIDGQSFPLRLQPRMISVIRPASPG